MIDLSVKFTGRVPLVVHNVRLANPLDPYTKAMKAITSKRGKTEEDHLALMRIEWEGGLYWDEDLGPYLPCSYPVACLRGAGALNKNKANLERGMVVTAEDGSNRIPIKYTGPRGLEEMWAEDEYRDMRMVKVNQSRTPRCRPRFAEWAIEFRAMLDEEVMDLDVFEAIADRAGRLIGLGEKAEGSRSRFIPEVSALVAA